ncbi:MAG: hypothetical protein MJA29_02080, partial [Candidatus Omnitrophica bacterium]|nr:hypothetical protein [Candidatus Omnitrophota bacterium]
ETTSLLNGGETPTCSLRLLVLQEKISKNHENKGFTRLCMRMPHCMLIDIIKYVITDHKSRSRCLLERKAKMW